MLKQACGGALLVLGLVVGCGRAADGPVAPRTVVAFDLETTGFSAASNRTVEIAAVKFRGGEILEARSWLINPGGAIPPRVIEVHGIRDDMVGDAPAFPVVFEEFRRFVGDAVPVAHNARFDAGFLKAELQRHAIDAPAWVIVDSLDVVRAAFPDAAKHSIEALADLLGLGSTDFHRALADSMMLARILIRLPDAQKTRLLDPVTHGVRVFSLRQPEPDSENEGELKAVEH